MMKKYSQKRVRFTKGLAKLRAAFQTELSDDTIAVYWEDLQNFKIEQIEEAFDDCRRNCKFFPRIAEIIETIRENQPYSEQLLLEYHGPEGERVSQGEAQEYLREIFKRIDNDVRDTGPQLTGERAEKFEEKRRIARAQAEKLLN